MGLPPGESYRFAVRLLRKRAAFRRAPTYQGCRSLGKLELPENNTALLWRAAFIFSADILWYSFGEHAPEAIIHQRLATVSVEAATSPIRMLGNADTFFAIFSPLRVSTPGTKLRRIDTGGARLVPHAENQSPNACT